MKKNKKGLYECHRRIIGDCIILIPRKTLLVEKMVERTDCQTLHRGANLTMTQIRRKWIPKLRQLTKKIIRTC